MKRSDRHIKVDEVFSIDAVHDGSSEFRVRVMLHTEAMNKPTANRVHKAVTAILEQFGKQLGGELQRQRNETPASKENT